MFYDKLGYLAYFYSYYCSYCVLYGSLYLSGKMLYIPLPPKKDGSSLKNVWIKTWNKRKIDIDKQMGIHEHNARQYQSDEYTRSQYARSLIITKFYISLLTGLFLCNSLLIRQFVSLAPRHFPSRPGEDWQIDGRRENRKEWLIASLTKL